MAGAGYKLFNTGDVLTAAQVNTYLNEQTVMVFASSAARTSALSGVLAEGMMSYLQDTNSVEVYNGSSWVNVGNAGDITEVQAGVGISIASGTGPIPVITNSSTDLITTAGDILYGTAADTVARLGIGTAGQVLKVNSGATAPEWGATAAGALSFIKRSTFTTAANTGTSFDNVFTSTYKVYQVVIESLHGSSGSADLHFQWRSGGVTDATGYNGYLMSATTTWANNNWNNASTAVIALSLGGAANEGTSAVFWCSHVKTGSNEYSQLFGFSNDTAPAFNVFGGYAGLQDNDGFILSPSTGTFTGTVAIYGLATS